MIVYLQNSKILNLKWKDVSDETETIIKKQDDYGKSERKLLAVKIYVKLSPKSRNKSSDKRDPKKTIHDL